MKKLVPLLLLVGALVVVSGCTVLDAGKGGSSGNYPTNSYPEYRYGGGHGGHSH